MISDILYDVLHPLRTQLLIVCKMNLTDRLLSLDQDLLKLNAIL